MIDGEKNLVVGYNDMTNMIENFALVEGYSLMGFSRRTYGGPTTVIWFADDQLAPLPGFGGLRADPWLAVGPDRRELWYGFVTGDAGGEPEHILIRRSEDGGANWDPVPIGIDTTSANLELRGSGSDKPSIAAGNNSIDLYAAYLTDGNGTPWHRDIVVWRSYDRGANWEHTALAPKFADTEPWPARQNPILGVDPVDPNLVLLAYQEKASDADGDHYVKLAGSVDRGKSFEEWSTVAGPIASTPSPTGFHYETVRGPRCLDDRRGRGGCLWADDDHSA